MNATFLKTLIIGGVLALSVSFVAALSGALRPGDVAPSFVLRSLNGQVVSLEAYRGRPVVLGLFHICEPCLNQSMAMQEIAERYAGRVGVIGVNIAGDSPERVSRFLARFPRPVTFPYLLDPTRSLERAYQVRATPVVVVLDRQGVVQAQGSSVPAVKLAEALEPLLN